MDHVSDTALLGSVDVVVSNSGSGAVTVAVAVVGNAGYSCAGCGSGRQPQTSGGSCYNIYANTTTQALT
ncbi:unnamed protein product [Ceratitis capitata]|uniref:(Mediterranean fruit fly) hypothetical protein n=1 Tax=Ceratitis capitata TaxID=7213 RepID=A0A811UFY8_CERCA|nr:unnamed protein product [Ceratitis capitata]